ARTEERGEHAGEKHIGAVAHHAARRAHRGHCFEQLVEQQQRQREQQAVAVRATLLPVRARARSQETRHQRGAMAFQKSIPPACCPMSIVATFWSASRSITSTAPGSEPIPSCVTKAYRSSEEMVS